jgi:hypothetical protein
MSDEISYAAVEVLVLTRSSALGPLNRTGRRIRFVSPIGGEGRKEPLPRLVTRRHLGGRGATIFDHPQRYCGPVRQRGGPVNMDLR